MSVAATPWNGYPLATAGGEKVLQECCGGYRIDPAIDLRRVVAGGAREDPCPVFDAAALGVISAEIKPPDPRKRDRARAHGARLQGDVEIAAGEPLRPQNCAGFPDSQHLRMRRGVPVLQSAVTGAGQHLARGRDNDGPYGDFTTRGGGAGFFECHLHEAICGVVC